jgi:hypothetical protein
MLTQHNNTSIPALNNNSVSSGCSTNTVMSSPLPSSSPNPSNTNVQVLSSWNTGGDT